MSAQERALEIADDAAEQSFTARKRRAVEERRLRAEAQEHGEGEGADWRAASASMLQTISILTDTVMPLCNGTPDMTQLNACVHRAIRTHCDAQVRAALARERAGRPAPLAPAEAAEARELMRKLNERL